MDKLEKWENPRLKVNSSEDTKEKAVPEIKQLVETTELTEFMTRKQGDRMARNISENSKKHTKKQTTTEQSGVREESQDKRHNAEESQR